MKAQFTIDLSAVPAKRPSVLPGVGCRGGVSGRFGLYLSSSAIVGLIVRIGVTAEVTGGDGTSDINAATFFRNVVVR